MSASIEQLPLALNLKEVYRFDNFYFKQVELQHILKSLDLPFIYLWGGSGVGKSHLLMAVAERESNHKKVLYLSLADLVNTAAPQILDSIAPLELVCIDDLDVIVDYPEWQEALFHCFNRLQQSACQFLIAAQHNPATIDLSLPDLRSRMGMAAVYQLDGLNDEDKQYTLILQAKARGLDLSLDVAQHLLRYQSRDMKVLMAHIQRLDEASMATQRRLTIPFIRHVLHG